MLILFQYWYNVYVEIFLLYGEKVMNFYRYIFYLYIFLVPLSSVAVVVNNSTHECVDSVSDLISF